MPYNRAKALRSVTARSYCASVDVTAFTAFLQRSAGFRQGKMSRSAALERGVSARRSDTGARDLAVYYASVLLNGSNP
jgi:hypothetical protein